MPFSGTFNQNPKFYSGPLRMSGSMTAHTKDISVGLGRRRRGPSSSDGTLPIQRSKVNVSYNSLKSATNRCCQHYECDLMNAPCSLQGDL